MGKRIVAGSVVCLMFIFGLFACKEDAVVTSSIEGKWVGNKSEIVGKVDGIPIPVLDKTDNSYNDTIEFKTDGTVLVTSNGVTTGGTWKWVQKNKTLQVTADFHTQYLDPTETFTLQELTATNLTIYIKKEETFTDPQSGSSISGPVTATLYFNRMSSTQ